MNFQVIGDLCETPYSYFPNIHGQCLEGILFLDFETDKKQIVHAYANVSGNLCPNTAQADCCKVAFLSLICTLEIVKLSELRHFADKELNIIMLNSRSSSKNIVITKSAGLNCTRLLTIVSFRCLTELNRAVVYLFMLSSSPRTLSTLMIIALQPPKKLYSEKEKQEKIIWTDKFYEGSKGIKTLS